MSNSEYREAQQQARDHGLKARQEARLENATYTAAEVKVLTETASKVGYALGRLDAGEEIAEALERCEDDARRAERTEGIAGNRGSAKTWFDLAAGYMRSAELAREIASRPSPDATSGRTDPGMDSDLPPEPQAVREPRSEGSGT